MKTSYCILFVFLLISLFSCKKANLSGKESISIDSIYFDQKEINSNEWKEYISELNQEGNKVNTRFNPPEGYSRVNSLKESFAYYLQNLPLKPHGSKVHYYDGKIKDDDAYLAVVDKSIGNKNLHQCADAIMRYRAEYLWQKEDYDNIHFNCTNGFRVDYTKWMEGNRLAVKGNDVEWKKKASPSNTKEDFWKYMESVFMYAGTLSLSKELKSVDIKDIQIGDVFIQGGSPGHAIIVVDLATNDKGNKVALLAQSYMPAQEGQILRNLRSDKYEAWYEITDDIEFQTPSWYFETTDLMRF